MKILFTIIMSNGVAERWVNLRLYLKKIKY